MDELEANSPQPLQSSWPLSDSICSCRSRRRLTRHRQVWSSFVVSSEFLISTAHDPNCQFLGPTGTRQTVGTTFEYTGLRTLFQKAITLSFHMTFGAGGFSVNPGISYVPLVNHESAPAFRLVHLLRSSYSIMSRNRFNTFETVMSNILRLYRQGRASPRDTDTGGRSLMHHLAQATASWIPATFPVSRSEKLLNS